MANKITGVNIKGTEYDLFPKWENVENKPKNLDEGIQEASGNVITLVNSGNTPLNGLTIYGKTIQDGTPTPDAPVDLVSVGDSGSIDVTVCGKNLFDPSKLLTVDGWTVDENGVYSGQAIDLSKAYPETNPYMTFGGIDQLTLSFYGYMAEGQKIPGIDFYIIYADGTKEILATVRSYTDTYYTATTTPGKKPVALYFAYGNAPYMEYLHDIQIEVGTTATTYEPYVSGGSLTVSTPNGLPGVPVSSGGNYTDSNGQQWVCDEIDLARGVYVQNVFQEVLTATHEWYLFGSYENSYGVATKYRPRAQTGFCTHYPKITWNELESGENGVFINSDGYQVVLANTAFTTLAEMKAFVKEQYNAGTPITVMYPLRESIETALGASVLDVYANLYTHNPNTTIYNDADAHMKVFYYTPTATVPMTFSLAHAGKHLVIDKNGNVGLKMEYGREVSTSRLTDAERAAFATLEGNEFLDSYRVLESNNLWGFSTWAYQNSGVDISSYMYTVHKSFIRMFNSKKNDEGYLYEKLPDSEADPNLKAMLVEGSYSGGADMLAHGYKYTLTAEDYQIGDLFCMRYVNEEEINNCYYIALYQADDTFLLYKDFSGVLEGVVPGSFETITYTDLKNIIDNTNSVYYYVLRPDNLAIKDLLEAQKQQDAENQELKDYIDEVANKLRDMNIGKLTETEKTAISVLETSTGTGSQLPSGAVWAYKQVGIDISPYIQKNVNNTRFALFDNDYNYVEDDTYYHTMLVPSSYGGTGFVDKGQASYELPISEYQIGDIFCGRYSVDSSNRYWAAIYQGNNQFIVRDNTSSSTNFIVNYDDTNTIYNANPWLYYYVLRPENIAIEDVISLDKVTSNVQTQLDTKVPTTRTINDKALSNDITLTASDIGLGNVENKSSEAIRSEITWENIEKIIDPNQHLWASVGDCITNLTEQDDEFTETIEALQNADATINTNITALQNKDIEIQEGVEAVDNQVNELYVKFSGELTNEQKEILSNLEADISVSGGGLSSIQNLATWSYKNININLSPYFYTKYRTSSTNNYDSINDIRLLLINSKSVSTPYHIMKEFLFTRPSVDSSLTEFENPQIGDIYCGATTSTGIDGDKQYRVFIYIGNQRWLHTPSEKTAIITNFFDYPDSYNQKWYYYYVLRPENVLRSQYYGLFLQTPQSVQSVDKAIITGWYTIGLDFTINKNSFNCEKCLLKVESLDNFNKKQTLYHIENKWVLTRYMQGVYDEEEEQETSGIWTDWAWENPPMSPRGREYLTTEFWCGEPIYTTYLTFGNTTSGSITIDSATKIIKLQGILNSTDDDQYTLPYYNGTSLKCNLWTKNNTIYSACAADVVSGTIYAQVWYTK